MIALPRKTIFAEDAHFATSPRLLSNFGRACARAWPNELLANLGAYTARRFFEHRLRGLASPPAWDMRKSPTRARLTAIHHGIQTSWRFRFQLTPNLSPNMGRPLLDDAAVASSWMTSQCSTRIPSLTRRMSAAIQFTGWPKPENRPCTITTSSSATNHARFTPERRGDALD